MAGYLSEALGTSVKYEQISYEQMQQELKEAGTQDFLVSCFTENIFMSSKRHFLNYRTVSCFQTPSCARRTPTFESERFLGYQGLAKENSKTCLRHPLLLRFGFVAKRCVLYTRSSPGKPADGCVANLTFLKFSVLPHPQSESHLEGVTDGQARLSHCGSCEITQRLLTRPLIEQVVVWLNRNLFLPRCEQVL